MTPLILAASAGRVRTCHMLISKGANVNEKNNEGHSALQYAASKGWNEVSCIAICALLFMTFFCLSFVKYCSNSIYKGLCVQNFQVPKRLRIKFQDFLRSQKIQ